MAGPSMLVASVVAGCGGSSPTLPSPPGGGPPIATANRPPIIVSATVSLSWGMADVQPFEYHVDATDADGDRLTYNWQFGSGLVVSDNAVVTVKYPSPANGAPLPSSPQALLNVVDGKGGIAAATVPAVMLATGAGEWTIDSGPLTGGVLTLLQFPDGGLRGAYQLPGDSVETLGASAADEGSVAAGGVVRLPLRRGSASILALGQMDQSGRLISGTLTGAVSGVFTMKK